MFDLYEVLFVVFSLLTIGGVLLFLFLKDKGNKVTAVDVTWKAGLIVAFSAFMAKLPLIIILIALAVAGGAFALLYLQLQHNHIARK